MTEKQKFNTAIAGVMVNLVFGFISIFTISLFGASNNLVYLFIFYFGTLHLSEAISYLTISNIFLASDMEMIANYNNKFRIPCFIIGCITLGFLIYLISKSIHEWKIYLVIFNVIVMICMGFGRVIFTFINKKQGYKN